MPYRPGGGLEVPYGYTILDQPAPTGVLSGGGATVTFPSTSEYQSARSVRRNFNRATGGKFYVEFQINQGAAQDNNIYVGVRRASDFIVWGAGAPNGPIYNTNGASYAICRGGAGAGTSGGWYANNGWTSSGQTNFGLQDNARVGIALDCDNGRLYFRHNGTWINGADPVGGTDYQYSGMLAATDYGFFAASDNSGAALAFTFIPNSANWGAAAPSGYIAIDGS